MRIALIGAAGQLGSDLNKVLNNVVPLSRSELDITSEARVRQVLDETGPQVVINTAAYNLVDQAESEIETAFAVNAFAVRNLARWCQRAGAVFLHVSTDYVFGLDRTRDTPYTEDDLPGPLSAYGASKLAGEGFAQSECDRHFVVRTCGLYGRAATRTKGNFVETMLRLAASRSELRVVNDQFCTPTYTRDLAEVIARLVTTEEFGLYHVTNAGQTSWYGLAAEIFRQRQLSISLEPISTEEFGARAARPSYSVLATKKVQAVTGLTLRGWQSALADYLSACENPS